MTNFHTGYIEKEPGKSQSDTLLAPAHACFEDQQFLRLGTEDTAGVFSYWFILIIHFTAVVCHFLWLNTLYTSLKCKDNYKKVDFFRI